MYENNELFIFILLFRNERLFIDVYSILKFTD